MQGLLAGGVERHFAARLEAGGEQLEQQARNHRVALQRLFHVRLGERHAGLQRVLGVAAQHGDVAPFQAGAGQQLVEAVVLGVAVPDGDEGLLERQAGRVHVDRAAARLHLEVLDRDLLALDLELIRMLGEHAQAQVLHHRQHVRQRHVAAAAHQLQAQVVAVAVEGNALVAGTGQARGLQHVGGGQRGGNGFGVAGGQRAAIALEQAQAHFLAVVAHQQLAQLVVPVAHDAGQFGFQAVLVELDLCARLRADHHVQLGQRRFADLHAVVQALALQFAHQQRFDAVADAGVEAVARDVGQRGEEAAVAVAAQEQAGARALLQAQDAHRGALEFLGAGLEQLFARQRFQYVAQGLAAVAVQGQARGLHHRLVALAHQRDFPRAAVVGAGGVQAQEALLAHGAAGFVEHQHADVVHVAGAVHGGAGVGLGEDERVKRGARGQVGGGQAGDRARLHQVVLAAHQAQAAAVDGGQLAVGGDFVFAVAQEGEVVVGGPAQEGLGLEAAGAVHGHGPGVELVGDAQHFLAHHFPVGHGLAHVAQSGAQGGFDGGHGFGVGLAVDFQVHQRFGGALAQALQLAGGVAGHAHHGVGDLVQGGAELGQRHAHGIHQEGHVVVGDAHDGVAAVEAVGGLGRVEHGDLGGAGRALAGEAQEGPGDGGPVGRIAGLEFVLRQALVEAAGEALQQVLLGGGQPRRQGGDDGIEGIGGSQGVGVH